MKFCSQCGSSAIGLRTPLGDNRERYICTSCNKVFYHNPKIVAGCILEWEEKILLCKRAIEPQSGFWTVPAGFLENGESVKEGAVREALEEAHAQPECLQHYSVYSLLHVDQVYILFRGKLKEGKAAPGDETLETRLFHEQEIVWEEIAFPVVRRSLEFYFKDKKQGRFGLHSGVITRDSQGMVRIGDEVSELS